MSEDSVQTVIDNLSVLQEDQTIPKNIRSKLSEAMAILVDENTNLGLRIDRSIEGLGELADDPNLQPYVRMQLWSIVSQLESH